MKGKWLVTLVFVMALTAGTTALAQSGDTPKSNGDNQSTNTMAGMEMSGSGKDSKMAGMDMGEGPVKETPANIKILGTYGAVNFSFILIGIWNKWFRRKDDSLGNSR